MSEETTISELVEEAHKTAVDKGWWDEDREPAELIALIHSELSEALEVVRNAPHGIKTPKHALPEQVQAIIDESRGDFVEELADAVIRIADTCGALDLDLEKAIEEKMEENKGREYRHGGKRI